MKSTLIRVHFFEPIEGKSDFYFGSVKAIFSMFTKEQIGCSMASAYSSALKVGHSRSTERCLIEKAEIVRSPKTSGE